MKLFLTIFGLMVVLAFGAVSLVDSYTPANAGPGAADDAADDDDIYHDCHDDGDDGENPGVVDDPDNEDTEGDGEEVGDPMEDPNYEDDDPQNCRVILPDTQTPAATPCPSIIYPFSDQGCCPDYSPQGEDYTCVCSDSAGPDVVAEYECYCPSGTTYECLCELGGIPSCCEDWHYYCGGSLEAVSTDVNCDGEVTTLDAYESLVVLSGFESSTGDGCGGGDADCSDAVDAGDTLAILTVVAGLEEPAVC